MILVSSGAAALACAPITPVDIADIEAPAIVVLGERHGDRGDLKGAAAVVRALARRGPVTVALEAVAESHQDVLDRLEAREIRPRQVEEQADWSKTWGHPFRAYLPILGVRDVDFVAAGPPLGSKPADVQLAMPEIYPERLRGQALAHGMEEADLPKFAQAMAWRDLRIAELALEGWSGQGALVIVAGRGHVAEGLGITWQLERGPAGVPVHRALLSKGETCGEGDRYLP